MSPKLTEWFGREVNPTIPGVYQTDVMGSWTFYQHWDGCKWGLYASLPEHAAENKSSPSFYQRVHWRGLAEKPE